MRFVVFMIERFGSILQLVHELACCDDTKVWHCVAMSA
jgi:hypothetical protein